MTTFRTIESFLASPAIAVVGASRSGHQFGNTSARVLREKGYRVYLVHPHAAKIGDMTCYARLAELPEQVNALLIVVPPWEAIDVVAEAAAAGICYVWLQQGAESEEALNLATKLPPNLTRVLDRKERMMPVVSTHCVLVLSAALVT